jgi:hypothetical protein
MCGVILTSLRVDPRQFDESKIDAYFIGVQRANSLRINGLSCDDFLPVRGGAVAVTWKPSRPDVCSTIADAL